MARYEGGVSCITTSRYSLSTISVKGMASAYLAQSEVRVFWIVNVVAVSHP
jgi:hypothetical protein